MSILWLTDPHLNFLGPGGAYDFGCHTREDYAFAEAAIVTGDVAECPSFAELIEDFARGLDKPVHFVLGNHDAYHGSISEMRVTAGKMKGRARWLVSEKLVDLGEGVALIGHDGWYDARFGDYKRSQVILNDFITIREFGPHGGQRLVDKVREVADMFAAEAKVLVEEAIAAGFKRIVFATHVPPFAQSAWHQGAISDYHWLPWMSSRVMGEMLEGAATANPDVRFLVLCGHTHSSGKYKRCENLTVLTGHSAYRYPRVCGEFDTADLLAF